MRKPAAGRASAWRRNRSRLFDSVAAGVGGVIPVKPRSRLRGRRRAVRDCKNIETVLDVLQDFANDIRLMACFDHGYDFKFRPTLAEERITFENLLYQTSPGPLSGADPLVKTQARSAESLYCHQPATCQRSLTAPDCRIKRQHNRRQGAAAGTGCWPPFPIASFHLHHDIV